MNAVDKGIYERNLRALKAFQRDFDLSLIEAGGDISPDEGCADKTTVELHKNDDGFLDILYNGTRVHESRAEVISRTEGVSLKGDSFILSFGLGLGLEAREIIRKMDSGTNYVIVLASDELFSYAVRRSDFTDIISAPNVYLLNASFHHSDEGVRRLSVFLRGFISSHNYNNLSAVVISPLVRMFFENCRRVLFAVDLLRESFELNEATIARFSRRWQENALKNARACADSLFVSSFFGGLNDIPAIIVSAGPSLSKNIAELKNADDNCVIISVDTALKPLLQNGIRPHFVVSLDAQEIVFEKLSGIAWDENPVPLIYVPVSSAEVVSSHKGVKILSPAQDEFFRACAANALIGRTGGAEGMSGLNDSSGAEGMSGLNDSSGAEKIAGLLACIDMGGSVSTGAFSFAQRAGCNPIVLIGQDLAYTNGRSHTDGAVFAKDIDVSRAQSGGLRELYVTDGLMGTPVYTDRIFETYKTWLKTHRQADTTDRRYINATEGGALIDGFEKMRLKEFIAEIDQTKKNGVTPLINSLLEKAERLCENEKASVFSQYKRAALFLVKDAFPAAKEASLALKKIERLLSAKKPNLPTVKALYNSASRFEGVLKKNARLLNLLGLCAAPAAMRLRSQLEGKAPENETEKAAFHAKLHSEYYAVIADKISEHRDLLRDF